MFDRILSLCRRSSERYLVALLFASAFTLGASPPSGIPVSQDVVAKNERGEEVIISRAEIEKVVTGLKSDEKQAWDAAFRQLTLVTPAQSQSEIAEVLLALLKRRDDLAKHYWVTAATALAAWGDRASWKEALKLLDSSVPFLGQAVADGLASTKDEEVGNAIATKLGNLPSGINAAKSLQMMGAAGEAAAANRLKDTNKNVRMAAAYTLRIVGTAKCLAALEPLIQDQDAQVLELAQDAVDLIRARGEKMGNNVVVTPANDEPSAIKSKAKSKTTKPKSQSTKKADPKKTPEPERPKSDDPARLEQALNDLRSSNKIAQSQAAKTLAAAKPPRQGNLRKNVAQAVEETLRKADATKQIVFFRRDLLVALGNWGDAESVPTVAAYLKNEELRDAAIKALARLKYESSAEMLVPLLVNSRDTNDVSTSLQTIGPIAERHVIGSLQKSTRDARREAAKILLVIGTAESIAPLEEASRDTSYEFRAEARHSLLIVQDRVSRM
jgi:HEAT repeat protein